MIMDRICTKNSTFNLVLPRVLHHVCLRPQKLLHFVGLQQVNQFKEACLQALPPPPQTGLLHWIPIIFAAGQR